MQLFSHTNYDFLRWRVPALVLSWVIILAGFGVIAVKGLPLGLEFSGGTIVIAKFDTVPSTQAVRTALDAAMPGEGQTAIIQRYGDEAQNSLMVRVSRVGAEDDGSLAKIADDVVGALRQGNFGNFDVVGTEVVGPVVGQELTRKGVMATVLSLVGILAYIAFRFRLSFAVGAVVATIHDLLITMAFLAFFRYDLSLNVIAAILTVVGYSTNDTIVIFDRVRENMRGLKRESSDEVVNRALNQTLGRTAITAGTTLLAAVALFLFGGEVLRGFAFTMIVGVVTGTYSSLFIAAAVVTFWRDRALAKTAAAPVAAEGTTSSRAKKATRGKARAS